MGTPENTVGMKNDPTTVSPARRRIVAAGLALAILAIAGGAPRLTYAGRSSTLPVAKCSDFACEQRSADGSNRVLA